ncbi:MAG: hypothetical protein LKJ86_03640 [Oscillibacter sp.]|jgi:hypothetical protein|nr:hypothetical protein [Oscillibacter sp.]
MDEEQKLSDRLSELITFLRSCEKEYQHCQAELQKVQLKEQDLIHYIELYGQDDRYRCHLATELRTVLMSRRAYKDWMEELEPLAAFLSAASKGKLTDELSQVLGDVRKAEKYHRDRVYRPRALPPNG